MRHSLARFHVSNVAISLRCGSCQSRAQRQRPPLMAVSLAATPLFSLAPFISCLAVSTVLSAPRVWLVHLLVMAASQRRIQHNPRTVRARNGRRITPLPSMQRQWGLGVQVGRGPGGPGSRWAGVQVGRGPGGPGRCYRTSTCCVLCPRSSSRSMICARVMVCICLYCAAPK